MGNPLRFRVQMIGFGDVPGVEPLPGGIIVEIEWLTSPACLCQVPLSRTDYFVFGDALVAAMNSQDICRLRLDGPELSPLPALLRAVREGKISSP